ncbi:MAG: hypothetical protein ACR2O2_10170, partial [Ruegeria sp.]
MLIASIDVPPVNMTGTHRTALFSAGRGPSFSNKLEIGPTNSYKPVDQGGADLAEYMLVVRAGADLIGMRLAGAGHLDRQGGLL